MRWNAMDSKPEHYILATLADGRREPIACASYLTWAQAFKEEMRRVAYTKIKDVEISTVFLGTDHNWTGTGKPVLFETMVFQGRYHEEQERYCTWDEAVAGHAAWVRKVKRQGFFWRIKEAWQTFKETFPPPQK